MTESRPCHKLKGIQAFRGFAILLIVMSHVVGRAFDFGGEAGVCFFFVMSGFVLSMANDEKLRTGKFQTMRFVFHQLRKFYPLLALSLSFFVFAYWHAGYPVDYGKLLTNLLLIQTWFCSQHLVFSYVGSSWFLCDILVFYLFFKPLNQPLYHWEEREIPCPDVGCRCRDIRPFCFLDSFRAFQLHPLQFSVVSTD